jgi:WD40 repeat protein
LKSLDTFQNEWYEMTSKRGSRLVEESVVPDVYCRNQELARALEKVRIDVESYKDIASKARSTYDKLRKERDFHRMHHKRVVQEKAKLISDIKRLKGHYESYEPMLRQLQAKYETAMKEKMLIKLERDKLASRVLIMERGVATKPTTTRKPGGRPHIIPAENKVDVSRDAVLPPQDRVNPYISASLPHARITDKGRQVGMIRAHTSACFAIAFHPKKSMIASVGDDKTWKLWSFPNGEPVSTTPATTSHKDWISDLEFNPRGTALATASGDHTIKIWDIARGTLQTTLSDHAGAVWSVAYHDTGDFIASTSQDHTVRLYDLVASRCRQTFRGHADAVLTCAWTPYGNTLATGSGDKTVSLWDARTGLCAATLYGHGNAVNCVAFSLTGERFASCDADGGLFINN